LSVHSVAGILASVLRGVIAASLALVACTAPSKRAGGPPTPTPNAPPPPTISFIEDDWARALTEGKRTHRSIFVDAWAPWCHTCSSMRVFVFADPALATAVGADFVWASIDTEKPSNAAFVEAHPMEAWPTLFVVQPEDETTVLKWAGSATTAELVVLLEDVAAHDGKSGGEAAAAFLRGERAAAEEKHDVAIDELRAALTNAPPDWPRRSRVVEALVGELTAAQKWGACVELAVTELPDLPSGTSRANVAVAALACGEELPKKAKERVDVPVIADIVARMAADKGRTLLADDRSSLFEALVDWRQSIGDAAAAKTAATAWATFLEDEAAHAKTKEERSVFDAHRLLAYLALGEPARALPMLQQSEQDFPNDYNPPARLARVYFELGRLDDALAAIDRALARVYGPRTLRVAAQKADILQKQGKKAEARAALEEALDATKSLTLTGGYAKLAAELRQRASKL